MARRYGLAPRRIGAFLKRQNFDTEGREAKLSRPSSLPPELSELLRGLFNGMYKRYEIYRATGVVLMDLVQDTQIQYSLFEDPLRAEKIRELYEAVDAVSGKYGKHTLHLGASHPIRSSLRPTLEAKIRTGTLYLSSDYCPRIHNRC